MTGAAKTTVPFAADAPFVALKQSRTGWTTRWFARVLLLLFAFSPVVLTQVPWQQTIRGRGQVVAFAPTERRQVVTARIGGPVSKWHVVEGSVVKAGDPIVDIEDNDPGLAQRLDEQKKFLSSRRAAAGQEIAQLKETVAAQERALAAAVGAANANKDAAEEQVKVAGETKKNNEFAARFELDRFRDIDKGFQGDPKGSKGDPPAVGSATARGGLVSGLERDEAKLRYDRATTDVHRADAEVKRAEATVKTNESLILQAEAAGLSAVAVARGNLERAEQNRFDIEQRMQELDSRIEQFKARFVVAPAAGIIHRITSNTGVGGQFIKQGDELVEIVPDTTDRVVELMIDGVDAPLIAAFREQNGGDGPHVRLQFEGWPGVQFAGWPSVAVGTFGGKVRQMDPTDDGYGRFRVLIQPDQMFEGDVWPEGLYLRQGNQAVGWVFLNRVTIGYELWRQFNGFPPVIAPAAPGKGKDKDDKAKPPKIKPGG